MANLLGIDTSTEACTVALSYQQQVWQQTIPQKQHADRLLAIIDSLLQLAGIGLPQLDAIVWGRGPGMFTGLRIGAGVVQGLAYASGLPVISVSSLAILAQAEQAENIITAMDARMGQVYWCAYHRNERGELVELVEERVDHPSAVLIEFDGKFVGVGPGWDAYHESLTEVLGSRLSEWRAGRVPEGKALLALGELGFVNGNLVTAAEAIPVYVRDNVAVKQRPVFQAKP